MDGTGRRAAVIFAALATTCSLARAQTHARDGFILGQDASLSVSGAPGGAFAAFLVGFNGLGRGQCMIPPWSHICFDIREPTFGLATLLTDASGNASVSFVMPTTVPLIPVASQVIVLDPVAVQVHESNAIDGPIEDLSALDDAFDGNVLSPDWTPLHAHLQTHTVQSGQLRLRPTQAGNGVVFIHDWEGPGLHKLVRGDFTVTTTVRAVKASDPAQPAEPTCRVGGLLIRDPASVPGDKDWLFFVLGAGDSNHRFVVEDKTTDDSVTTDFLAWDIPDATGELKATRRGTVVTFYYRRIGAGTWIQLRSFDRPDFPAVLQVGLCLYSVDAPPDVEVRVDEVRFSN